MQCDTGHSQLEWSVYFLSREFCIRLYACMPIDVAKKLREISHHISTTGVLDSEARK